MELEGPYQVFAGGCLGALALEMFRWVQRLTSERTPRSLAGHLRYLLAGLLLILLGGIAALWNMDPDGTMRLYTAAQLGALAPVLLRSWLKGSGEQGPRRDGPPALCTVARMRAEEADLAVAQVEQGNPSAAVELLKRIADEELAEDNRVVGSLVRAHELRVAELDSWREAFSW